MRARLAVAGLLGVILICQTEVWAKTPFENWRDLQPGVSVFSFKPAGIPEPNSIKVVAIDPAAKAEIRLVEAKPGTGGETADVLCRRVKCLAAVNGGFFQLATGQPVGGGVLPETKGLLGFDIPGIVSSAIVIRNGEPSAVHPGFSDVRHPRTMVCGNPQGKRWLIVDDGRQPHSLGLTIDQAATAVSQLGCTKTINLDGGCSTVLVVAGKVENRPCNDGRYSVQAAGSPQRKLPNILAVVSTVPRAAPPKSVAAVAKQTPPAKPEVKVLAKAEAMVLTAAQAEAPPIQRTANRFLRGIAMTSLLAAAMLAWSQTLRLRQTKDRPGAKLPAGLPFRTYFCRLDCPPRRPILDIWSRLRLTAVPPFLPISAKNSGPCFFAVASPPFLPASLRFIFATTTSFAPNLTRLVATRIG